MNRKLSLSLIALLVILACDRPIERSALLGTYQANHNRGEELLVVKENGQYIHSFKTAKGTFEQKGNWEYQIWQGDPIINFYNFNSRLENGIPENEIRNVWPAFMEKTILGKIRMSTNVDLGLYFEKIETEEKN